jgi:hypothetical protein
MKIWAEGYDQEKGRETEVVILWEFRVRTGKRREFEGVYGPEGAWVQLFRRGEGCICTELIRDVEIPCRYLTD